MTVGLQYLLNVCSKSIINFYLYWLSGEREALGVGGITVAILLSCQYMKDIAQI